MKLVNISFQPEYVFLGGFFPVKSLKTSLTVSKFYLKWKKIRKSQKIAYSSQSLHGNTWSTIDPVMLVNISFQPEHVTFRGSLFSKKSKNQCNSVKIPFKNTEIIGNHKKLPIFPNLQIWYLNRILTLLNQFLDFLLKRDPLKVTYSG